MLVRREEVLQTEGKACAKARLLMKLQAAGWREIRGDFRRQVRVAIVNLPTSLGGWGSISIFHQGKLRLREPVEPAQDHMASEWCVSTSSVEERAEGHVGRGQPRVPQQVQSRASFLSP